VEQREQDICQSRVSVGKVFSSVPVAERRSNPAEALFMFRVCQPPCLLPFLQPQQKSFSAVGNME
jgi:hypothetical protein